MKTTTGNSNLEVFMPFAKTSKFAERITGKNCVRFERVSSKEQKLGFSLDTQAKSNLDAIMREGFNCVGAFGGTYESGKTAELKEFNRMLNFVRRSKEKISYIVVPDATRFSRSGANAIYIASQLRKENIQIYCVNNPSDTRTAAGKMQQNVQFVFAEYDNDLKSEKIIQNSTEMLLQGYWCTKAPLGYTQVTRHKRFNTDLPERQITTVNETGKLLRKAFYWKAEGLNNAEILKRLDKLGLKLIKQKLDKIFANPFYCGLLVHNWLNGKVVEGKHEPLVSKEIFLKANNMRARNCTWKHNKDFSTVPLKNFMKCDECGSTYCGYLVKKKNLWYYKCNKTGCKCNRSAKAVNEAFEQELTKYLIPEKYIEPVRAELLNYSHEIMKDSKDSLAILKGRLNDLQAKIGTLNERWALGIIQQDLYTEYITKFIKERSEINVEMDALSEKNSNLEKRIEKYLQILVNPAQLWASNGYAGKLELQELLFPQGILYNRKNDCFRTPEVNEVALIISGLAGHIDEKLKGDVSNFQLTSPSVLRAGLEPARL